MALHRVKVGWLEKYEGEVFIKANSKEEAIKIVESKIVEYTTHAMDNYSDDAYLGIVNAKVSGYNGIAENEKLKPDNIE